MSLSSHLNSPASPIGQFIKQHFSYTSALTRDASRQLRVVPTLRPVIQMGESYPYTYLGAAIDYRIRYAFDITPYQRLVAWYGAVKLAVKPPESDEDILLDWEDLIGIPLPPAAFETGVAQGPYPLPLIRAFFQGLEATLIKIQPTGRLLNVEDERTLDRLCIVLSLFEQVFRTNTYIQGPLMQPTVKRSVEELLAIPQDAWLDDLSQLFNLFHTRQADLLSLPHILNPTFAGSHDVGGADADLIVDGCLIDIKTSISPQIRADYLYQLAGYLLLDYNDTFHINTLGIYMARQGVLLKWNGLEFLQKLTGDEQISLASLRREFRELCRRFTSSRGTY